MTQIPIKQALARAIAKLHIANATGNKDLRGTATRFIREYWPKRHKNLYVMF